MNILVVENTPQFGGGCETMSLQMSKELHQRGHQIVLAHENDGNMLPVYQTFAKEISRMNLPCFGWRNFLPALQSIRSLAALIDRQQVDVIFTSHLGHLRDLAILKALYRTPTVYYLGLPAGEQPDRFKKVVDRSRAWAVRQIHAGVACSWRIAESWKSSGWPEKTLAIVPHWVDFEKFKPVQDKSAARRKLNLPENAQIVLYVGRVVQDKGVEILIHAFAKIREQINDALLVIVGRASTSYASELQDLITRLGIERDVVQVGGVSNAEAYFSIADITVVPSICDEAFGIVVLESMACRVLTIVSSSGELPNVMGKENSDLVFESENSQALGELVVSWLEKPEELRKRGDALRQYTLLNYSQSDKLDVYEKLMLSACHG